MSEIRILIEQLVAAGVDPVEAAEVVSRAAIHGAAQAPAPRTARQERNARYYASKSAEKRLKASEQDVSDGDTLSLVPLQVSPQTPFPKTLNPIPPSPPKGGSSPTETDLAFDAWDEMAQAAGLAKARVRSQTRRSKLAALLRSHGMEVWREACRRVGESSFCRGEKGDGWKADLDFVLQAKSFGRILEGHYDDRARGSPPRQPNLADAFAEVATLSETRNDPRHHASDESPRGAISYLPRVQGG